MKWWLLVLVLFSFSFVLADNVVVNQVLYDPVGTETGGEAIQLYNPTNEDVDLTGLIVKTKSYDVDATVIGTINAGSHFLIADSGWDENKDDPSWPSADYEEAISLGNSDAGLAIILNNVTLDVVGWGDAPEGLFLGSPASEVDAGLALKRIANQGDNSLDFEEGALDFVEENNSNGDLEVDVEVLNSVPELLNATFPLEVLPLAGQETVVNISLTVEDANGYGDVNEIKVQGTALNFKEALDAVTAVYEGAFLLNSDSFGEYEFNITLYDGETVVIWKTLNISSLIALSVDVSKIGFESIKPDEESIIFGDLDLFTANPTVKNIGNVALDLGVGGGSVKSDSEEIQNGLMFSFDNNFDSELSAVVEADYNIVDMNLEPNEMVPLGLKLYVPIGTAKGSFSGAISVVGVVG